ncbi:MAG: thioredoxin fold domain-containing protein [Betaproteobacteria bacterium]|nr:thioredoxin fold domain-containing protein [Betaproteobacteria bacterium]
MKSVLLRVAPILAIALAAAPSWAHADTHDAAPAMLSQIGQATYIAEGHGVRIVYIFFDPNCLYCHRLYQDLRPWVGRNGLQFRWIPVGMLTSSSTPKAAAILQSSSPLQALKRDEKNYSLAAGLDHAGGIAPAARIASKVGHDLKANLALLVANGVYGVPAMLFRDTRGQPRLLDGAPASPSALRGLLRQVR